MTVPVPVTATETGVLRLPDQVLFGAGSVRQVPTLVAPLGSRVLIVTDSFMADTDGCRLLVAGLRAAGQEVVVFDGGVPELPLDVVDEAVGAAGPHAPDVIVGFGGGSSMDLAKAVALLLAHPGPLSSYYGENLVPGPVCPVVAVPTTAGTGSEVTPVLVVSDPERQFKVGVSSPYLVPRYAVVDPELTHGCPVTVTAHSGADAFAHALESLTAGRRTPGWGSTLPVFVGANRLGRTLALDAVEAIGRSLARAVHTPGDADARASMAYASLTAAMSFGSAGTHLGHAVQYAVGAATHTSHGLGVGLLLPYVLELGKHVTTTELLLAADRLDVPDAPDAARVHATIDRVQEVLLDAGIPRTLADIGVARGDLAAFADQSSGFARLVDNGPVPADRDVLLALLEAAWLGDRGRVAQAAVRS
jgi:alcohol dehydrogenase